MSKWIQSSSVDDEGYVISLQDKKHFAIFGPILDVQDKSSPPFYLTLKINEVLLYNCMLYFMASYNLMPKFFMKQHQLQVTRTYHDLYTFE